MDSDSGLRRGVESRLEFIEFRLFWEGHVNRSDLIEVFGVSTNQASTDLNRYLGLAEANMVYDKSARTYVRSSSFTPVFHQPDAAQYLSQLRSLSDGIIAADDSWIGGLPNFACAPTPARGVSPKTLRAIVTAIKRHEAIEVFYQSMSYLEPAWRWIEPHALVFDGFRWHARAHCPRSSAFKDFVLSRITDTRSSKPADARPSGDSEWEEQVELQIAPHPELSVGQRKAIELDYGMERGVTTIPVRRAPRVDDVNLTPSKRTCLVLSPDAKSPPAAAARFFDDVVYKNAFCVVAGDGSKMASAEDSVRRLLAIAAVKTIVADTPRHQREIETEQETTEIGFNSTVKSLFNAVWYPQTKELKSARIDLGHFQERGVIQGEKAVEAALAGGGAKKLVELDPEKMDGLIQRCEDQLFPENQSRTRWSDVLERAASNPRWIWLPPKGMEEIKSAALVEGRWVEENGYVDKSPPPPRPLIRVTRIGGDEATGESELELAVSNAGRAPEVLVAPTREGLDAGEIITDRTYRTTEVELWFQARNPDTGDVSEPYRWAGSITITHERRDNAGMWQVTLAARPEAELRWNTSGINPKDGAVYNGGAIEIDGRQKATLYVYAVKGGVGTSWPWMFSTIKH